MKLGARARAHTHIHTHLLFNSLPLFCQLIPGLYKSMKAVWNQNPEEFLCSSCPNQRRLNGFLRCLNSLNDQQSYSSFQEIKHLVFLRGLEGTLNSTSKPPNELDSECRLALFRQMKK